jgi:hypothetical protein
VICNGKINTFLADRRMWLTVITLRRTAPAAIEPDR